MWLWSLVGLKISSMREQTGSHGAESWLRSGGQQIQASRNLCFTLSLAAGEAESLSREECSLVWRDVLLTGCGPHTSEGSFVLCSLQS